MANWPDFLSTLIGAGVGSAFVQGAVSLYQYQTTQASTARYLAIRLATLLESYAAECLERMWDQDNYMGSLAHIGKLHFKVPDFPEWPVDDEGWRRLRSDAVALVYKFKAESDRHQKQLALMMEVDFEDVPDESQKSFAALGATAFRSAQSLRRLYQFPESAEDTAEKIEECLRNKAPSYHRIEDSGWS